MPFVLAAAIPAGVVGGVVTAAEHGPRNMFFRQRRREDRFGYMTVTKFKTFLGSMTDLTESEIPVLLKDYLFQGIDHPDWLELLGGQPVDDESLSDQHGLTSVDSSRIGNGMRVSGVDEAPQVVDIIRGLASITGPRSQTDQVLESRLRVAPMLFNDWFTGFYEPFKKGPVSPGGNWYHRTVPQRTHSPQDIIINVMERDLDWVPKASLATDLRLIAETPVDILVGLTHHITRERAREDHL